MRDRDSWGSVIASLIGQGTLVISGPVTARLLGVTGRGELALLAIVAAIASQLGAMGLPTAAAFVVATYDASARTVLRLLGSIWIAACTISGLAGAVAVVVLFSARAPSGVWLDAALVALLVPSYMTWSLILGCLQGERRFRIMNILRPVASTLVGVSLLALLLIRRTASVTMVLGIFTVVYAGTCVLGGLVLARGRVPAAAPPAVTARSILRYGLASLVGATAPLESLSLDQAAVGLFLSKGQLGLYVVGSGFSNLPSIIISGLGTIALPRVAAERQLAARRHLIIRTLIGATAIALGATVVAELVVAPILPFAFGVAFVGALPVARILIVAGFFLSIRRILVALLLAVGRPGQTAFGEIIGVGSLIALAVILTPTLGLIGASIALTGAAVIADIYLWFNLTRGQSEPDLSPGNWST